MGQGGYIAIVRHRSLNNDLGGIQESIPTRKKAKAVLTANKRASHA